MGYWPKKQRRRRHSWAVNVGRKLVLLGAQGSHSKLYLCEVPIGPEGACPVKLIWRGQPNDYRVVGWAKHYYLDLPDGRTVQGKGTTSTCLRAARLMEII